MSTRTLVWGTRSASRPVFLVDDDMVSLPFDARLTRENCSRLLSVVRAKLGCPRAGRADREHTSPAGPIFSTVSRALGSAGHDRAPRTPLWSVRPSWRSEHPVRIGAR